MADDDLLETPVGTVVLDRLIAVGYVRRREGLSLAASFPGYLASREARVEILPQYEEALRGLEERELAWILWYPHVEPRRTILERTLPESAEILFKRSFSNRGWLRPNPIMLSLVRVIEVRGRVIRVLGLDAIDGTPVLDVKPWEGRYDDPREAGCVDGTSLEPDPHKWGAPRPGGETA